MSLCHYCLLYYSPFHQVEICSHNFSFFLPRSPLNSRREGIVACVGVCVKVVLNNTMRKRFFQLFFFSLKAENARERKSWFFTTQKLFAFDQLLVEILS